jgi:PAS domain S-box-containing protein
MRRLGKIMEYFNSLIMSDLFIPHGHCYLWKTELVGLHLISDLTIAIAYFSIPLTLFYFVEKREDLPFNWIFSLFGAFIILCGTTHLLEVWTLWHPVYWLSGTVKALTAMVSVYTAVVLVKLIPQALMLPSPAQLASANQALQQQIRDRELAEAQIQQLNEELEARVARRTQELEASMRQVQNLAERMTLATDAAQMGIYDWNLVTDKLDWNDYHARLMGYVTGASEYSYADWEQRVHPDDLPRVKAALQLAMTAHTDYSSEHRVVWQDRSIHWIDGFGRFYYNSDDRPVRMTGIINDITERKQNEEALRRSEEFTRRVLQSNQDCIKVLDLEGRLLYMNDGGQLLMEIDDFATIANTKWVEFWQGVEVEYSIDAFNTAKAGGIGKFEGHCNTAKGTPKWWEVVVTPMLDADGQVEQILSVSRDITERQQSEIALQASEELFRNTFEHTPLGFAHVALDGALLRVNRKFCEIVGYTNPELLATTFQAITEPADLQEDLDLIARLVNGEIDEYTLEKRYIHKQGYHVWVNLTVALIRSISTDGRIGIPQYFLAAVKDITERKKLEFLSQTQTADLHRLNSSLTLAQQQLQERNQELDRFVSIAAHDLKAPLRGIANLSEWIEEDLQEHIPGENPQLQLLRQRVKRMDALIDGLLRYSRAGKEELTTETINIAQLLTETIDSLSPPTSFEIIIVSNMPTLDTKRLLLSQVFANLISNAIKHHERVDGRIEITAEDLGDRDLFSIADDGPGIPEGSRERIFEIFQTLHPTTDSTENTGIGLALVKKIVEGEGGEIWLDEEFNQGCRFCFTWLKTTMPS